VAQEEFPVAEMTFKGHSKSLALTLFGRSLWLPSSVLYKYIPILCRFKDVATKVFLSHVYLHPLEFHQDLWQEKIRVHSAW